MRAAEPERALEAVGGADTGARLAAALERQNELLEALLREAKAQKEATRLATVLYALGPEVAGDLVHLDAREAAAVIGVGRTRFNELVRDGLIPMRRLDDSSARSKRRIAVGTLREAIRQLGRG
ncbi:MAG TPA: hypothetical protein EYQ24_10455 [Bacteroidetes bacterium]|nr:hypothetical protein [Bacteroidota bacterium]